jgi:hypothetical protein
MPSYRKRHCRYPVSMLTLIQDWMPDKTYSPSGITVPD